MHEIRYDLVSTWHASTLGHDLSNANEDENRSNL